MLRKNYFSLLLITLFIILPCGSQAQGLRIFAKQKVVIADIMDRNDRQLDPGTKSFILQSFKDAFVNSDNYEVFEVNLDDIKRQLTSSGKQFSFPNICKNIGQSADYIVFTEVELTTTDLRANGQNVELIFTSSLYRISTASKVMSDVVKTEATEESVRSAVSELISKLLGENLSSKKQSNQQSSGYSSNNYNNGYSNTQSYVENVSNKINGHEYVDLGLSVKWATCNIGANFPDNPGKYYAWGETSTKVMYIEMNSITYQVMNMGDIAGDSRYDVARASWGGTWRLPTKEEFEELINCCTWEWTKQNGVDGYKVTSRYNGKSIFLPAAGIRYDSSLNNAGSFGYYWSSSPNGSSSAFNLYFFSSAYKVDWDLRYYGRSVRAVCE
ncbi:MAG: hypothetical protein IKU59_03795 [Bacteroidales bacterium]|nr:hypothetical protein [Bacteroidales bacterium]